MSHTEFDRSNNSSLREGIVSFREDGVIVGANQTAKILLQIDDSMAITSSNLFSSFEFYPAKTSHSSPDLKKQINQQKEEIILGIKSEKNKICWISFRFYYQQHHSEIQASLIDITHLFEKKQKLKKIIEHQRKVVSSIHDLIFEVSSEGVFLNYWTKNVDFLFVEPADFINKKITELFPSTLSETTLHLITEALKTNTTKELLFQNPASKSDTRWFKAEIKPVFQSQEKAIINIIDVTEDVQAKNQTLLNNEMFYQTFHYSGVGTSITSLDGYLIDANETLLEILGRTKKELKRVSTYEISHPDDMDFDIKHRNLLINSDQKYFTYQKRYLHKKGYYIWCIVTISLVRKNAEPHFFIVQLQDITEPKRNIQLLQAQKIELENIKIDLESKIIQLEESNYIIAHNLKSPISNIEMLIESINKEKDLTMKDKFWILLEQSVENLKETLKELNNVINIKYNSSVDYENCDFEEVINGLIQYNKQEVITRNITITTDIQAKNIYFPKTHLENIIDALIRNAVTFVAPDTKPVVHIKTYKQDDNIIFEIKDNGLGIDLEKHKSELFMFQKIFHRGFQGRGVGLFMVKYRVEYFGGKVDVESKLGEGSTFFIKFLTQN